MDRFMYNAFQCKDFTNLDDENKDDVEAYFEFEHEAYNELVHNPVENTISRSYSTSDIRYDNSLETDNGHNQSNDSETIQQYENPNLVQKNSLNLKSQSLQTLLEVQNKYISLAEAVKQFHTKTPDRFHSKSSNAKVVLCNGVTRTLATIPSSPFLRTKQRTRCINILTHQERELKEFQEMQKFKIKAHPLNTKILTGPIKVPCVLKKPLTEPKPFNLTEVITKRPPTPIKPPPFHARPVPTFIKESVKPVGTPVKRQTTVCYTPKVLKRQTRPEPVKENKVPEKKTVLKPIVEPILVFERFKQLQEKKERALFEIAEQEKKKREFHAKPLPKIYSSNEKLKYSGFHKDGSSSTLKSSNETINEQPVFKAKPAKVLYMSPFLPKKEERVVEISPFQLHSEARAKQRAVFEQRLKEREEWTNQIRKSKEDEKLQEEQKEIAKFRILAQHKAQPIRKYKAVEEVSRKLLTVPVSPKFQANKIKNKENLSP